MSKINKLNFHKDLSDIHYRASSILYETPQDDGAHTYHICTHCNTYATRSGKCWWCIAKEIYEIGVVD